MRGLPPFAPKAPEDVLDFAFSFAPALLPDESVATAAIAAAPSGLTLGTVAALTPAPVARLSGGTPGTRYVVSCAVTTTAGRSRVASAVLLVGQPGLDDPAYVQPAPAGLVPAAGAAVAPAPVAELTAELAGLAVAASAIGTTVLGNAPAPPAGDAVTVVVAIT